MKGTKIQMIEEVISMPKDYKAPEKENKVQSFAEKYYENQGYTVIKNGKYEIFSVAKKRTADIEENNRKIENFFKKIGKEKELEILREIRKLQGEYTVAGQPDLFAFNNENDWFFAEIKSDTDSIKDPQKIVFGLLKLILKCELNKNLRLVHVTEKSNYESKTYSFMVGLNAMDIEQVVAIK